MTCNPLEQIDQISALTQSGDIFDTTMFTRLANVTAEVDTLTARLTSAGLGDLATQLGGVDVSAFANLSTHAQSMTGSLMSQMGQFSAIASMSSDTPSISEAFGPLLGARGSVAALDDISATLDQLELPEEELLEAMGNFDTAEDALASLQENLQSRVTQLQETPAQVSSMIANSTGFFETAQARIANASSAAQMVSMFQDQNLKAVLSSVVSENVLNSLKC